MSLFLSAGFSSGQKKKKAAAKENYQTDKLPKAFDKRLK